MSLATAGIHCTICQRLSGVVEDYSIVRGQQLRTPCRRRCCMSSSLRMFGSPWNAAAAHEHQRRDSSRRQFLCSTNLGFLASIAPRASLHLYVHPARQHYSSISCLVEQLRNERAPSYLPDRHSLRYKFNHVLGTVSQRLFQTPYRFISVKKFGHKGRQPLYNW